MIQTVAVVTANSAAIIGLLVTVGVWLAASLSVLVSRLLYDRRRRRLNDIARQLTDPSLEKLLPLDRSPAIRRILSRRTRREVYRLVASDQFPFWLTEACATYCLEHFGVEEIRRDASARHGRKWRRVSALMALGRIRGLEVYPLLEAAIRDDDPDVATAAAQVLFRIGDRAAAVILVSALRGASVPASRIATYLDQYPIPIGDLLIPLLRDPEPRTRYWAASLLERYTEYVRSAPIRTIGLRASVERNPDRSFVGQTS